MSENKKRIFSLYVEVYKGKGEMNMDEDILMAMLGNITQELEGINSEVSSIKLWMPNETDVSTTDIEIKLDRIIQLLEEILEK